MTSGATFAPNSLLSSSKILSMAIAGQYSVETDSQSIPATMQAAVYRGVNDVRLETVPVPEDRPRRNARPRPLLRRLRHRPQEDFHRIAFRTAHLRTRNFRSRRRGRQRRHRLPTRRPRHGLPPHSLPRVFLLPATRPSPSARRTRKLAARQDSSLRAEVLPNTSA